MATGFKFPYWQNLGNLHHHQIWFHFFWCERESSYAYGQYLGIGWMNLQVEAQVKNLQSRRRNTRRMKVEWACFGRVGNKMCNIGLSNYPHDVEIEVDVLHKLLRLKHLVKIIIGHHRGCRPKDVHLMHLHFLWRVSRVWNRMGLRIL